MAPRLSHVEKLRSVYRDHVEAVYAFLAYSVSEHVAEDLTSVTFEKVLKSWTSFDPERGSERAWVMAIARNALMDHFRRERYRRVVSTDAHPAVLDAIRAADDERLERLLLANELRGLMSQLPERDRLVVALRFGADLQASDIAQMLSLSTDNVHQIISRSLRRLRTAAEEGGGSVRSSV